MKRIAIIGIGMSPDTLTLEAKRAVDEAQVLLGASRMVGYFGDSGKQLVPEYAPERVASAVKSSEAEQFAVLVSGDVGFYSAASGLCEALKAFDVRLIPGISSVGYFFARMGRPWQDAAFVSCHGRQANFVDRVRRSGMTFALTGGNIPELMESLCEAGFGELKVTVGENLGLPQERLVCATAQELAKQSFAALAVLAVENPAPDARCPVGIRDDAFVRGEVPMTKSEIRAIIAGELDLKPNSICADLGAGTGSVTVEMALSCWNGHVYACDRNEEAIGLIRENCRNFHIGNVTVLHGDNLDALSQMPALDAAFIGGSGGEMKELVGLLREKNPHVRIVISAIAPESVADAIEAMNEAGLEPELRQISVARGRKAGRLHLMMAQNPITIISGGGYGG